MLVRNISIVFHFFCVLSISSFIASNRQQLHDCVCRSDVFVGYCRRTYRVCCPIFSCFISFSSLRWLKTTTHVLFLFFFFFVCVSLHDNDISYIRERFGPLVRSHLNYISHSTKHFRVCLRFFFPPNLIILIAVFSCSGRSGKDENINRQQQFSVVVLLLLFLIIHFFVSCCVCVFSCSYGKGSTME